MLPLATVISRQILPLKGNIHLMRLDGGWSDRVSVLTALPLSSELCPVFVGLSFTNVERLIPRLGDLQETPWPLEHILRAGYGLVVAHYNDFAPDDAKQFAASLEKRGLSSNHRAISVWAAGLMELRALAEQLEGVDPNRIYAIGHSRLGKTALWAAANDLNLAGVVSIQSGCGGAAPFRTEVGETVERITSVFPHWFADQLATYAGRENEMPWDQHFLLSLIAPRPLLLLNAEEDTWANPTGQDELLKLVRPLWPSNSVQSHTRPGKHEVLTCDWERAIEFLHSLDSHS